jgi:hypothetical protein
VNETDLLLESSDVHRVKVHEDGRKENMINGSVERDGKTH